MIKMFEKAGNHTNECLNIVEKMLDAHKDIVVASTTGVTGLKAAERFGKKANVVIVTHAYGYPGENKIEIDKRTVKKIEELGGRVFTGTILTSSLEKSFSEKYGSAYLGTIIADTLRRFGEGTKVCAEIVMEAADAGLVEEGRDIIAVAGTGRNADTVCIIKAATSRRFHDLKIREIVTKPRDF